MNKVFIFILLACMPAISFAQSYVEYTPERANRPVDVNLSTQSGALNVKTWEENMVRIEYSSDVAYTFNHEGNEVTFKVDQHQSVAITAYVPVNTNLTAKSFQNGAVQVTGVNGNMSVDSYNGAVSAQEISGTAVISAWNGAIDVSFQEVGDGAMGFTAYNGAISILAPSDTKATVEASLLNGQFGTGFGENAEELQEEYRRTENGQEKWQVYRLNGGGPEWRIKAFNGSVSIAKR